MRGLYLLLFAASGFAGLIYESIWTQYLRLFLGHAAYAQALVLAIFMGGMAIGAAIASHRRVRRGALLRRYAIVEGVLGLAALAFHAEYRAVETLALEVLIPALGGDPSRIALVQWSLGAALVAPQSVLLGMTFPLMSAGLMRVTPGRGGETLALLYCVNSAGGALGVLASGFWFIGALGLPGTVMLAGVVNLAIAIAVWRLAPAQEPPAAITDAAPGPGHAPLRATAATLLAVAAGTGVASFVYEIAWIRMLSMVLGSSTHAFELMLAAFIGGLALGGAWIRRRIDRMRDPVAVLAWVQVVMGLLALATLPVYGASFDWMAALVAALPKTGAGYLAFNVASHAIALAVMLPATFCAGMTLPLVTHALMRAGGGEPAIGRVYALNTLGAIAGVFLAVHAGFGALGLHGLVVAGAALDVALGLWLAFLAWPRARAGAVAAAVCAAVAAAPFAFRADPARMARGVFRSAQAAGAGHFSVIEERHGKTATVHVTRVGDVVAIRTNGKIDASARLALPGAPHGDEPTELLAGALPLLLHPGARRAANIGLGSGITTHSLLASPALEVVDTVEIEPAITALARHFAPSNARAYDDPRSRIHHEDARTFFSARPARYDIIVSEPSNPWVSGVAGLFTREYYAQLRRRLAPGGLFVQWIQLYEIDLALVVSILKAIDGAFADWVIYTPNDGDALLVARADGPVPPPDARAFGIPALAAQLHRAGVRGVPDVALRVVADRRLLRPFLAAFDVPANSDFRPVVDQGAARTRFLGASADAIKDFGIQALPLAEMLGLRAIPADAATRTVPWLAQARAAWMAEAFLAAVASPPPGARAGVPRAVPPEVAREVLRMLDACLQPPQGDKVYVLFDAALKVLPWASAGALERLWRHLAAWPCGAGLGPHEQEWLALFQAVGRRDAAAMATRAEALLESRLPTTPARQRYLLAVALLAAAARHDAALAERVVKRHAGTLYPEGLPWLMLRALPLLAGAR